MKHKKLSIDHEVCRENLTLVYISNSRCKTVLSHCFNKHFFKWIMGKTNSHHIR